MSKQRARRVRAARKAIRAGEMPRYKVLLAKRLVVDMPWLEFGGDSPAAIAEAARRSMAAELGVRPDQIEVD